MNHETKGKCLQIKEEIFQETEPEAGSENLSSIKITGCVELQQTYS